MKKFRRGKKFQEAYFDIGTTNQHIASLEIELECHLRNGQDDEAESTKVMIQDLRRGLKKYDAEVYDLDYYLPQVSGLYSKRSKKDIL